MMQEKESAADSKGNNGKKQKETTIRQMITGKLFLF
jgi:hypothetical protein